MNADSIELPNRNEFQASGAHPDYDNGKAVSQDAVVHVSNDEVLSVEAESPTHRDETVGALKNSEVYQVSDDDDLDENHINKNALSDKSEITDTKIREVAVTGVENGEMIIELIEDVQLLVETAPENDAEKMGASEGQQPLGTAATGVGIWENYKVWIIVGLSVMAAVFLIAAAAAAVYAAVHAASRTPNLNVYELKGKGDLMYWNDSNHHLDMVYANGTFNSSFGIACGIELDKSGSFKLDRPSRCSGKFFFSGSDSTSAEELCIDARANDFSECKERPFWMLECSGPDNFRWLLTHLNSTTQTVLEDLEMMCGIKREPGKLKLYLPLKCFGTYFCDVEDKRCFDVNEGSRFPEKVGC